MTQRETLRQTEKQWRWLAANPGVRKEEYDYGGDTPLSFCYLCEYAANCDFSPGECKNKCLLFDFFNSGGNGGIVPCEHNKESAYYFWKEATQNLWDLRVECNPETRAFIIETITENATAIADAAAKALEKLGDKRGDKCIGQ